MNTEDYQPDSMRNEILLSYYPQQNEITEQSTHTLHKYQIL